MIAKVLILIFALVRFNLVSGQFNLLPDAASCFVAGDDTIKHTPTNAYPNFSQDECFSACIQETFECVSVLFFAADFGCVVFSSTAPVTSESASLLGGEFFKRTPSNCSPESTTTVAITTTTKATTTTTAKPTTTTTTTVATTTTDKPTTVSTTAATTTKAGSTTTAKTTTAGVTTTTPSTTGKVTTTVATTTVNGTTTTTATTLPGTTSPPLGFSCINNTCLQCIIGATCPLQTIYVDQPSCAHSCGVTPPPTANAFYCTSTFQCSACVQGTTCPVGQVLYETTTDCSKNCVDVKYHCSSIATCEQCIVGTTCPAGIVLASDTLTCSVSCVPNYYCNKATFQCVVCAKGQCPTGNTIYTTDVACVGACKPEPINRYFCAEGSVGCTLCDLNTDCPIGVVVHDTLAQCHSICEKIFYTCLNGKCSSCKQNLCPKSGISALYANSAQCTASCSVPKSEVQFYCLNGKCQECRISARDCPDHIHRFRWESKCQSHCQTNEACFDINKHCQWHASQGQCSLNKPAMTRDCNATCGFCKTNPVIVATLPPLLPGITQPAATEGPTILRFVCIKNTCAGCLLHECNQSLTHYPSLLTCQLAGCLSAVAVPTTAIATTTTTTLSPQRYTCLTSGVCQPCILGSNCPDGEIVFQDLPTCSKDCVPFVPNQFVCLQNVCVQCLRPDCPSNLVHFPDQSTCSTKCIIHQIPPTAPTIAANCVDRFRLCGYWANLLNQCSQNKVWMNANCNGSCNKCAAITLDTGVPCIDTPNNDGFTCQDYVVAGKCVSSSYYMFWRCPVACNFCHLSTVP